MVKSRELFVLDYHMHDAGIASMRLSCLGLTMTKPDVFEKTLAFCEANKIELALSPV